MWCVCRKRLTLFILILHFSSELFSQVQKKVPYSVPRSNMALEFIDIILGAVCYGLSRMRIMFTFVLWVGILIVDSHV
jgi:hypothetical protein